MIQLNSKLSISIKASTPTVGKKSHWEKKNISTPTMKTIFK